jgi:two-component system sensor histidine kinase ChiS
MVFVFGCGARAPVPKAVRGVIDLSGWNFEKDGSVELNGQWAFYPGQLISPGDFPEKDSDTGQAFVNLPNIWKAHEKDGAAMTPHGVATYRLTVKIGPDQARLALMLSRPLSVAGVRVNGQLLGQTGNVGVDKSSESPRDHILFRSFENASDTLTIEIQVSNFHNAQGGLNDPVLLGSEKTLQHSVWQSYIATAFLGGTLFIMAVSHLLLFLLRRSQPANLYFGIYCLLQAIGRMSGDMRVCLLEILFPGFPWHAAIDLSIIPMISSVFFLVMFYQALFPWKYGRIAQWIYGAAAAVLPVYVALTPPNAFDPALMIIVLVSFTAFPYLFFRFIMDLAQERDGANVLAPGFLVLALGLFIDLFFEFHVFETLRLVPFAMLFFVLSYSFLISVRYGRTFSRMETLSLELEENNLELSRQIRKKERALRRERLEKSEKLRYQLNPHFLFNALTSIRGAISKDQETASNMVSHLSEFSRLSLSQGHLDILTVEQEIEVIRHYLTMEQMRLGEYLTLDIIVEPSVGKVKLPAFILQPLVENAIKYGSRTSPDALTVEVRVESAFDDRMCVNICNTGIWVDEDASGKPGSTGTGLKNVRERLEYYYGDTFRFDVKQNHDKVCIQLEMPVAFPEEPEGKTGI